MVLAGPAECQEPVNDGAPATIEATVVMEDVDPWRGQKFEPVDEQSREIPEQFKARLVLDHPLPAGSRQKLKLRLVNSTSLHFRFDRVQASCIGAVGRFPAGAVEPGGVLDGELDLKVPTGRRRGELTVYFSNQEKHCGSLTISYLVEGHLGFAQSREELRFDGPAGEWWLAGDYSAPVDFSRLEPWKSDSLKDVEVRIDRGEEEGTFRLVILAAAGIVGSEGISGAVAVRDRATGHEQRVDVNIRKAEPFQFSPAILYFRPDESEEGWLVATAILSLRPAPDAAVEAGSGDVTGSLRAAREGKEVEVRSVQLGTHSRRLTVRLPAGEGTSEGGMIDWSLNTGGKVFRFSTHFQVRSR